jgi:hypothetical protein
MDFRDPNSVGTFIYHCHLLEHEDGGMMGIIRVEPRVQPPGESHVPSKPRNQGAANITSTKRHILCGAPESLPAKTGF